MLYIDRTLQVKAALLGRPDLMEKIRAIFAGHTKQDGVHEPLGKGNSRWVYEVGECEVAPGVKIQILLKLKSDPVWMPYRKAARRSHHCDWSEFGAFEMYYDFVVGHLSAISFRSKKGCAQYQFTSAFGRFVKHTFTLSESWGGTKVAQGDVGAIPYFQMVLRHQGLFGQLTEGEPPFVEPKGTADAYGTMDDDTTESGRIIDLGPTQCLLIDIDRGGARSMSDRWANNLGVRSRGEKYFRPENRLDL